MTSVTVLSEKPINSAEVKEVLAGVESKKGELNYRANKTYTYLKEFNKLDRQKAKELSEKVTALNIPRMREEYLVKIIDTLPTHTEEVKALLSGYTFTVSQENAKKIAEIVKEFC